MHISREEVLEAVNEQRTTLSRLSNQFNTDEFQVVMTKSLSLVVLLQKLIAEQTKECEEP